MQLSWPEVGHGVVESKVDSGNLLKHPWKRARTTFQYLAVAIRVDRRPVPRSERPSTVPTGRSSQPPTVPSVTTPSTVNSKCGSRHTFFIGLEDTYQLLRGEMTAEQAEQFYRSAWTLGTTLQVTEDQWPPTHADFDIYWNDACRARRDVDDQVRCLSVRICLICK